ncbi:hypothetical protein [Streptomyces sp. SID8352]|uniref:hypothetical protein n=1 Tax=Streptomyces sp. SID8352 TaxID=2690338 RepID=UPI001367CDE7|nr:hypothetical protein [Streptomyces sp. SID8352]MYU23957.1 hypothetical protein [Streptomyces sp. SID8352]
MTTAAVPTDHERSAVRAYLRLLQTVRAGLDPTPPGSLAPLPPMVPPAVLAEAERALAEAGLAGNEEVFFRLLRDWYRRP